MKLTRQTVRPGMSAICPCGCVVEPGEEAFTDLATGVHYCLPLCRQRERKESPKRGESRKEVTK